MQSPRLAPTFSPPCPPCLAGPQVKKWRALLWDGQRQRFLGHFSSDTDAAHAYDRALLELKGSEAKTNFPASDYGHGPFGGDGADDGGGAAGGGRRPGSRRQSARANEIKSEQ